MKGTGFSIRRSTPDDAERVAHLMNVAFDGGEGGGAFDAAWWRWKYGDNPAGFHGLVAQDAEGRIVGHYGGVPIDVRVDRQRVRFGQNCDSCSDPSVRRGLRNPGLFVRLAQAYASTYGVPGQDAVMYGLPNRDVYRIGCRYLDYWPLRQQWLLVLHGRVPGDDPDVVIESVPSFDAGVDALFDRVAERTGCIAERRATFLNWRFRDDPRGGHAITIARDRRDAGIRAYAVHRRAHWMGRPVALLMDWLCETDDKAAAASLLRAVAIAYEARDEDTLVFVCPTSSPWFDRFQEWGFRPMVAPYVMTARPYDVRFEPAFLREHWYYTLADFDIF